MNIANKGYTNSNIFFILE